MKNNHPIEVEVRGLLGRKQFIDLKSFLKKNATYKGKKNRIIIDYSASFPSGSIENRSVDVRLRATNDIPEIIVKLGKWGGDEHRKELSVIGKEGAFHTFIEIFNILGLSKGVLCFRKSSAYVYKGVEFALVEVPGHSYYFEAEKVVSSLGKVPKAKKEIHAVIIELGLSAFTDKEYFDYIKQLNKEANKLFDYKKYQKEFLGRILKYT